MTSSESDNVEQAVDGAFRSAVTQAAALGRMVAQLREQAIQRAARQEEATSREMQRRYDAERQYARVMLSQADHDGWWNTATTPQVASVVATAQAWKDRDPEIARLASRVDDRAQARWGINPSARIAALSPAQRHQEAQQLSTMLAVDELDPNDPLHTLVADMDRLEHDTVDVVDQQDQTGHQPTEADRQDQQPGQEHAQVAPQDQPQSARDQQLDEFEALLRSNGIDERTIAARMLPERANAKPAHEAATTPPRPSTEKARTSPGMGKQRDMERGR